MSDETQGQRIVRLSRPPRVLSEALGIKKERLVHLATIFSESLKNDVSAIDTIETCLSLLHDHKINEKEFTMLCFDLGWFQALNATMQEISKSITGVVFFDKTSGELDAA